jgi:hypothetical protein
VAHGNGKRSVSGVDNLLENGFRRIGDEIKGQDRRHIEYRKNIIKFFRSDVKSLFVVDKTIKQPNKT